MNKNQLDTFTRNRRRAAISSHPTQTGLDYIKIGDNPLELLLYFVPAAEGVVNKQVIPPNITPANIRITGKMGVSQTNLQVQEVIPLVVSDDGGFPAKALSFDGKDDYIDLGSKKSLILGNEFTQEAWIYPTHDDDKYHGFLGYQPPKEIKTRPPSVWVYEKTKIHAGFGDGTNWNSLVTNPILTLNTWNHVAVTFDGKSYKVYINGIEKHSEDTYNGKIPINTPIQHIGKVDNYFQGLISEVRIWKLVRTPEKIQENINQQLVGNEPGLIGYWRFDEGEGQIANDSSLAGNNGKLFGPNWYNSTLPEGKQVIKKNVEQVNILKVKLLQVQEGKSPTTSSSNSPIYTLELVNIPNLDPFLAQATFSLEVESPREFDSLRSPLNLPPPPPTLEANYLARDYSSFRQLMLDRLSVVMPQWKERHPADLGIALVEVLAYVGDRLSYYQDAVATEAYLGTARRRISVGRHARLIDYTMHEGCNARVWVQVQVDTNIHLDQGTQLLTRITGFLPSISANPSDYNQALAQQPQIFETLHSVELFPAHNHINFYSWGARDFFLPQGTTSATLKGDFSDLKPGDVLIFEEILNPETGSAEDAHPMHRHPVRLTKVENSTDTLGGQWENPPNNNSVNLIEIEWQSQDALPFPLYIAVNNGTDTIENISVARGNIVLAEHGRRIKEEQLPLIPENARYRPRLQHTGLTHAVPYNHQIAQKQPASEAIAQDPRAAVPMINLNEQEEIWWAKRDLLSSNSMARDFVVEMESDGFAYLRFGNNRHGKQPAKDTNLQATYRIGNGVQGNVGHDAIAHIVLDSNTSKHLIKVRNPLPALGGTEPESIEHVRLYAPQVFRFEQKRCVTTDDYKTVAESHPEVQQAAATLRWTGSWYTVFIAVKRQENQPIDQAFKDILLDFLEPYRIAGYDIEIVAPRFVPLDIALTVQVASGYFASTVKQMLLETFSNADLPNGQRGFFHPDNFTFGQPVYLSQVVKTAMEVAGVARVDVTKDAAITQFKRWGAPEQGELEEGKIAIAPWEIAHLDNDPNVPSNGKIQFHLWGGL